MNITATFIKGLKFQPKGTCHARVMSHALSRFFKRPFVFEAKIAFAG